MQAFPKRRTHSSYGTSGTSLVLALRFGLGFRQHSQAFRRYELSQPHLTPFVTRGHLQVFSAILLLEDGLGKALDAVRVDVHVYEDGSGRVSDGLCLATLHS